MSMYYFPFEFSFAPGLNTKMFMAVLGLALAMVEAVQHREHCFSRDYLFLLILSASVSLISSVSMLVNQTPDGAYASFMISTLVWLCAAYFVCWMIYHIHGHINIQIVIHYLIAVCLLQCVVALIIEYVPSFQNFIDGHVIQEQDRLHGTHRLYGIGARFDVAGIRFSLVLISIGYLFAHEKDVWKGVFYLMSFFFIGIVGSMVARTTYIGVVIAMIYAVFVQFFTEEKPYSQQGSIIILIPLFFIFASIFAYNAFPESQRLFQFAFEGFFNLVDTGEWRINSTNVLNSMMVFPSSIKTWIIGDGYFNNPNFLDVNYIGDSTLFGYYMGTDIGYLRFIFYFGIVGLISIISFVVCSAITCAREFTQDKMLFMMALVAGTIFWLKVSTDIFLFFALFISVATLKAKTSFKS